MSSLSLFQTESALVGELWQLTKAKKAWGLSVTRPVISHGGAGPRSEAGIAGPPHGIVLFPPRPYHSPQVAANLPQLHPHSEAQYLQQISLKARRRHLCTAVIEAERLASVWWRSKSELVNMRCLTKTITAAVWVENVILQIINQKNHIAFAFSGKMLTVKVKF